MIMDSEEVILNILSRGKTVSEKLNILAILNELNG
jgi:hypothetical protein